ncbi:hemerythrin domain-containing protein [Streptomyces orinoci]|uniref:Hemerythrin domain-containing protein n=1 Tax=Streptomyces orinoci TaxID=67339 RepID=A0ABV3K0Y1_STRON|nr:hemerythrin domain-containing protein [Streptomyces orinoci]
MTTTTHATAVDRTGEIDFTVMYATHNAFRRDLDRLIRAAEASTAADGPQSQSRAGWENFKRQLHVHHTVEDAALWPRVERATVGRPADRALLAEMEAEHARLNPLLEAVDAAMTQQIRDLPEKVRELAAVLGDHMRHEEDSALPLIQEVLTPKDWDAFRGAMARKQGPKGAAVYIPWILDGISAPDRQAFLAAMPSPVRLLNRLLWEPRYRKRNMWGQ